MAMNLVLTAAAYTNGVGQSRTVCRKREEKKAHSEREQEFAGRKHLGRQDESMGLSNTGDYVSFTINIRPLGVALRSAYARGRPSG